MNIKETIEKIATEFAARIIEEADAQNITNVQEVHGLIIKHLSTDIEKVKLDVIGKANELLYPIHHWQANVIVKCITPSLDQAMLDYGALSCFVLDGEESGMDLSEAIYKGIVDGWGANFANAAEKAWKELPKK